MKYIQALSKHVYLIGLLFNSNLTVKVSKHMISFTHTAKRGSVKMVISNYIVFYRLYFNLNHFGVFGFSKCETTKEKFSIISIEHKNFSPNSHNIKGTHSFSLSIC